MKLTRKLAQDQVDGKWWTSLGISKTVREQENDHKWKWQWAKRLGELKNDRWHEAVAVQTEDESVQGAMLYWVNTTSFVEKDQGAVYVEALATAPRNRPWLVKAPLYRGVGDALLLRAVMHSYLLGLKGIVNLDAFDDATLLKFYENRFSVIGSEDGLHKMELGEKEAASWLRREGFEI